VEKRGDSLFCDSLAETMFVHRHRHALRTVGVGAAIAFAVGQRGLRTDQLGLLVITMYGRFWSPGGSARGSCAIARVPIREFLVR
jgi:hypothetical protein